MSIPADSPCGYCGDPESQHLTAPLMCADCARENKAGAFHAFVPTMPADSPTPASPVGGAPTEEQMQNAEGTTENFQTLEPEPVIHPRSRHARLGAMAALGMAAVILGAPPMGPRTRSTGDADVDRSLDRALANRDRLIAEDARRAAAEVKRARKNAKRARDHAR